MNKGYYWFRKLPSYSIGIANVGAVVIFGTVLSTKYKNQSRVFAYSTSSSSYYGSSWNQSFKPESRKWDTNWDRRDPHSLVRPLKRNAQPPELAKYEKDIINATPSASRHILLIRHGQYFDTADLDKDRFLTELGREQAVLTGNRLKQLELPYSVLISSTMTRAVETAKLIHTFMPELNHVTDDCLREGAPIPPEPPIGSWRPEPKFFKDGARIESAFRKYFHRANPKQSEDSYEIIVCHANVIRYFICRALQYPGEGWLRLCVANCSMSLITIQPDGLVIMEMMGDHGHIPPTKISFL